MYSANGCLSSEQNSHLVASQMGSEALSSFAIVLDVDETMTWAELAENLPLSCIVLSSDAVASRDVMTVRY